MRSALLKTNLCVVLLFLFSLITYGQTFTDVVHLKNGTVVRGVIIEQVPGKTIKVQTADALKIEINYSDIEKITKETSITSKENAITPGTPNNTSSTPVALKTPPKKYFFTAGAGFLSGDGIGYTGRVSVGLRLGKKFDLQAFGQLSESDKGLTRDAVNEKYERLSMRNFGIKGSMTISTKRAIHPYFGLAVGYSSSPYTTSGRAFTETYGSNASGYGYYDSYFINPAFGISLPIGKNNFFFTELNYNYHSWQNIHSFWRGTSSTKPYASAQFASLLVGVKF